MAGIKQLVSTDDLKSTLLAGLAEKKTHQVYVSYDADFDSLMLLVVPPETETVVHYVDEHVALLYVPDTREIVGLQVENFERSFVPRHAPLQRVWRLSEAMGKDLKDFGDMMLAVETLKPEVAREVVRASKRHLGKQGAELVAALA